MTARPSIDYCKTGNLNKFEKYNQNIHNGGKTIDERCSDRYSDDEIEKMKKEMEIQIGGGRRRRKSRRSKNLKRKGSRKSRKH